MRVTTTDSLLAGLLRPIFADFRRGHPDIDLETAVSNPLFSLSRREADVAVRPSSMPPETLVGRRIGTIAQAIYARSDATGLDGRASQWVGPEEGMAYRALDRWMTEQGLDENCRYRVDTVFGMFAAARDGAGLAVLPCYLADAEERLVRVGEPRRRAVDRPLAAHTPPPSRDGAHPRLLRLRRRGGEGPARTAHCRRVSS